MSLMPVSYTHLDVYKRQAHSERTGAQLYRNVPGNYESGIFRGAVDYFRD